MQRQLLSANKLLQGKNTFKINKLFINNLWTLNKVLN